MGCYCFKQVIDNQHFGLPEYLFGPDDAVLSEIGRLRITAWEADGARPSFAPKRGDVWIDSHDRHAHHWVLRHGSFTIAAARMCIHPDLESMPDRESLVPSDHSLRFPAASLNRLVVHPQYRGSRLSRLFDQARIEYAGRAGAKSILVVTHVKSRLRDLQDAGFVIVQESPHRIVPYAPSFVVVKLITGVVPSAERTRED
jgi:hypothetical protein